MSMTIRTQGARLVIFGYNAVLDHIAWITAPSGPFYVGDQFNLTGGQVMAYYKDGSVSDVTDSCVFDPIAGTTLDYSGEMMVTASYTDKQGNTANADTSITVLGLEYIEITTTPNKTDYIMGEPYDYTGLLVMAHYSDDSSENVTGSCVFSPQQDAISDTDGAVTVTAFYTYHNVTKNVSFDLQVHVLHFLDITKFPQTDYTEGDTYDYTGLEILAICEDGYTRIITDDCSYDPAEGSEAQLGTKWVTATFKPSSALEATTAFAITVKEASGQKVRAIQLLPTTFEESLASIRTVMSIPNKMLQRINSKKSSVFGNMSLNIVLCAGWCNYKGSDCARFALMDITPWVNREKYIYNFIDPATGVSQGIRIPSEYTSYREFYPHQYFWENCSGNNFFYIVANEGEIQEDEALSTPWASDLCIGFGSDVYNYNPFSQTGGQPYQALAANYMIVEVDDPNA